MKRHQQKRIVNVGRATRKAVYDGIHAAITKGIDDPRLLSIIRSNVHLKLDQLIHKGTLSDFQIFIEASRDRTYDGDMLVKCVVGLPEGTCPGDARIVKLRLGSNRTIDVFCGTVLSVDDKGTGTVIGRNSVCPQGMVKVTVNVRFPNSFNSRQIQVVIS